MPVSFDQLHVYQSSAAAYRALWHLLSVGTVWRDLSLRDAFRTARAETLHDFLQQVR